jgi:hypothetical protein
MHTLNCAGDRIIAIDEFVTKYKNEIPTRNNASHAVMLRVRRWQSNASAPLFAPLEYLTLNMTA